MSVRLLPRELGAILCCNGLDGQSCKATLQTGQVQAGLIRAYAKTIGWGRGLRKGRKRRDQCPEHFTIESELHAQEKVAREAEKKRRDELRKAKFSATPKPKKQRGSRATSSSPESSPSADSAPAVAT